MGRPRKSDKVALLGPLGAASARLQLLERAGLTPESKADILRCFIEQARAALEGAMSPLDPTHSTPDWHARLNAGAKLLQLIEALPSKGASGEPKGPQVVIVNEVPAWAREPKAVRATVIEAQAQLPAPQAGGQPSDSR